MFYLLQILMAEYKIHWDPKVFQTDFELPAITAVKVVHPSAIVKGCYFHFTQAIWRNARRAGLEEEYGKGKVVYSIIRRISAFPLLKLEEIDEAMDDIFGCFLEYD